MYRIVSTDLDGQGHASTYEVKDCREAVEQFCTISTIIFDQPRMVRLWAPWCEIIGEFLGQGETVS